MASGTQLQNLIILGTWTSWMVAGPGPWCRGQLSWKLCDRFVGWKTLLTPKINGMRRGTWKWGKPRPHNTAQLGHRGRAAGTYGLCQHVEQPQGGNHESDGEKTVITAILLFHKLLKCCPNYPVSWGHREARKKELDLEMWSCEIAEVPIRRVNWRARLRTEQSLRSAAGEMQVGTLIAWFGGTTGLCWGLRLKKGWIWIPTNTKHGQEWQWAESGGLKEECVLGVRLPP